MNKTFKSKLILTNLIQTQKEILLYSHSKEDFDIMNEDGNAFDDFMESLKNKERTLKIEYAKEQHVTKKGIPRSIDKDGRDYFYTHTASGVRISAKDKDDLYIKLYDEVYGINHSFEDISFDGVYKRYLDESYEIATKTNNISGINSLKRVESDYKRYILPELQEMDISKIDADYLMIYTKKMLLYIYENSGKMVTKKAFNENYKGLLKKVFGYAKKFKFTAYNPMLEAEDLCAGNPEFKKLLNLAKKSVSKKVFQKDQIDMIDAEIDKRFKNSDKFGVIYAPGYMFKLEKNAGLRAAELCSLMWDDIDFENLKIHVHSQQQMNRETKELIYKPITKDQNMSEDQCGECRYVPIFEPTLNVLLELKEKQEQLGIESKWVFCHEDGSWIRCDTEYMQVLRRLCKKFGFELSNNHGIRMYFNSYVLIPAGVIASDRAKIMGHSIEVNLKNYTFESAEYCENSRDMVNEFFAKDKLGDQ